MYTKFLSNQYIEEYASGNPKMDKHLKPIRTIIDGEPHSSWLDSQQKALDMFTDQEGIELDKAKIQTDRLKSADIVTIIGSDQMLAADVKLDIKGGSSIFRNQGKDVKDKFPCSKSILEANPKYQKMGLSMYPDLVIILPDDTYPQIRNMQGRFNKGNPFIDLLRLQDFYDKFFKE